MNKRNIYLVQVTNSSEGSYMLPYSVGTLIANAWQEEAVREGFEVREIIVFKDDLDVIVQRMDDPYLVGFSNNIWSACFNYALAEKIKQVYPSCKILFGGREISLDASFLHEYPYMDYLIHLWGEEPFRKLLLELLEEEPDYSHIENLSYRAADGIPVDGFLDKRIKTDFPSPYLTGVFDKLISENHVKFVAGFETNRGCPFHCTYCDWDTTKSKITTFPLEKIFAEIDWIAAHEVDYCGCFDSNFGILERDELIVDKLVETKKKTGYPHKLQVSAAKADNPRVFRINKKLNDCGMSKGVTLSMQSLCPDALQNVDRQNLSLERYSELLAQYREAGIPTFTDIILGLPGETYDSFCDGLCKLIEAGQHSAIFVYACNLLRNSLMWNPEYVRRYKIETVDIPFSQYHCDVRQSDEIVEYSKEIISTSTMSRDAFIDAKFFAHCLQCFHCFGLMQCFSIYLFHEKHISYSEFYKSLVQWVNTHPDSVAGQAFSGVRDNLIRYGRGEEIRPFVNKIFGNITWPFEEGAYLEILLRFDRFYEEMREYLDRYHIDEDFYAQLLAYQKCIIKLPGNQEIQKVFDYDFSAYFHNIYCGSYEPLKQKKTKITFSDPTLPDNWKDYSKFVVWFGRKGKGNVYTDIRASEPDAAT